MIDIQNKSKQPLKTIRFQMDHFPTEEDCDRYIRKDEDVQFYVHQDMEISYNNIRKYNL